jgi:hypothetical protein
MLSSRALTHAVDPPLGLVELTTFPLESTATQSRAEGHEIPVRMLLPSTAADFHNAESPVGCADVMTSPCPTATHSDTDGHDTALPPTPAVGLQLSLPPVGSVEVNTFPPAATHNDTDGHDTPDNDAVCPRGSV